MTNPVCLLFLFLFRCIHGHDVAEEVDKDIAEYLVQIARSVSEYLKDHDQPLLLVGDTNRVGNTRPHISYDNLLEENISGNFEHKSLTELYDLTIEVINKYDSQRRHKLIDALLSADGKNIVVGNDEIAEAAKVGRIERIYIPAYRRTNDSVRPDAEESIVLQLSDEIKDIETVVSDVLSHGGSVQAVEIGSQHEIQQPKALCRY